MKRFQFSLEQFLKYRTDMTNSAKSALAGKIGAIQLLEQEIEEGKRLAKQNFISSRERFNIQDLRQSELYIEFQVEQYDKAKEKIRRLENEKKEVQRLYQERLKNQLVLEHLKENTYQKYLKRERYVTQIRLDDMINSLVHADNEEEEKEVGDQDARIW
ncbi:hypothetical protein PVA45_00695 [Entomospira entomophila]|uniref:Flagellar FliJ protein n=1 Tax=Entomospira entomophila TaxID=2719988 RepID=A0A968G7K1_9SPIO|nr:hypothetical protein [Entomospira entomophilus]NIZ40038.1 hypothetical protein [Entomospira entomophilus]WDI35599.1 hypothetical protein PVA45_00695 [Entomospira entomophilus]